jgi:nitrogen fixation NifU-like protein
VTGSGRDAADDLYQQIILDHFRKARACHGLDNPTVTRHGHNPLCGDELDVTVRIVSERVEAIGIETRGCAISQASASVMVDLIGGLDRASARAAIQRSLAVIRGDIDGEELDDLGDVPALGGVHRYAARVKCAALPWHTLADALEAAPSGD